MTASDYLTSAESALARVDYRSDPDRTRANLGAAQVLAIQAVAAALDRLAAAVEALQAP